MRSDGQEGKGMTRRLVGLLPASPIAALALTSLAFALDGTVNIHDPSTTVPCNGKFYTWGTGLISDVGWTWRRGVQLPRRGLAPDVIQIGDRYYVYIAANIGAQPKADIINGGRATGFCARFFNADERGRPAPPDSKP